MPDKESIEQRPGWMGRLKQMVVPAAILLMAVGVVFLIAGNWNTWASEGATQKTDDAYVRADVTPLSTKVAGLVATVQVSDYQSVKSGQLLVQLRDDDFRAQVQQAEAGVTAGQDGLVNNQRQKELQDARIMQAQEGIRAAEADIAAAEADAERAQAMLDEARANRADLHVIAPFSGTVATRTAEPGEVVTAGTPIVTMVNLGQVYLRAFVPGGQIGRVKIGQPARVYLDSAPTTPIEAAVIRIDPEASFTPENTYFREDRVKQVVGVKLLIHGALGYAKPGMPADGEILVDGSWPARGTRR